MRVSRVNVVFEFAIDKDIILSLGLKIKDIQKTFNAKVQTLNVPPAVPPETPRLMILFEDLLINVCLNRFEYIIEIPPHINKDIESSFSYVFTKMKTIYNYLSVKRSSYTWTGVVATIEYPHKENLKSSLEVIVPIFDKIIGVPRNGKDLASFQLQFGFNEGGLYKNFTISGYDTFNVKATFQSPNVELVLSNESSGEIIESGVSVTIDINNKPSKSRKGAFGDFEELNKVIVSTVGDIPSIFNIGGFLDE